MVLRIQSSTSRWRYRKPSRKEIAAWAASIEPPMTSAAGRNTRQLPQPGHEDRQVDARRREDEQVGQGDDPGPGPADAREGRGDRRERDEVERLAGGALPPTPARRRSGPGRPGAGTARRTRARRGAPRRSGRPASAMRPGAARARRTRPEPPRCRPRRRRASDPPSLVPGFDAPGRRGATRGRRSSRHALRHRGDERRSAAGGRPRGGGRGRRLGRRVHVRRDRDRRATRCTTRGSCSRRWRCGRGVSGSGRSCSRPRAAGRGSSPARPSSLDVLSGGRLVLPVGLGTLDDAGFGNVGEPTPARERAERLDETLAILDGLESGEPFGFEGEHYRFAPDDLPPTPRPAAADPRLGRGRVAARAVDAARGALGRDLRPGTGSGRQAGERARGAAADRGLAATGTTAGAARPAVRHRRRRRDAGRRPRSAPRRSPPLTRRRVRRGGSSPTGPRRPSTRFAHGSRPARRAADDAQRRVAAVPCRRRSAHATPSRATTVRPYAVHQMHTAWITNSCRNRK